MDKSGLTWDALPEERATLKDIDPKTVAEFKEMAIKRFPAAAKEKSISGLLSKLHLLSKGKPTRAAILLFGRDPRVFYISSYIKIGRFKDDATLIGMDEVYGNLFQQAEGAMEVLKKKYLQTNIKIRTLRREEELEYPEAALREAIVNAIVHRDYSAVHTQLKVYPDQLTLWNNGELSHKLTIAKLRKKHSSYPRNELIADVFYKASYIEAWGHGTVKMMAECKKAGLPEPIYEEDGGGMLVTFRKDVYTEDSLLKMGFNDRQMKAILYLKQNGRITNMLYQKISGASERTATRDLTEMVRRNILEQVGKTGKGTEYLLRRHKDAKDAIKAPHRRQKPH
ncbi:MAG: ATP-binding protein [Bacteroidia bacterium]